MYTHTRTCAARATVFVIANRRQSELNNSDTNRSSFFFHPFFSPYTEEDNNQSPNNNILIKTMTEQKVNQDAKERLSLKFGTGMDIASTCSILHFEEPYKYA